MAVLNPAALPVAEVARLLTRAGGQSITAAMIERDIDDGAPLNGDGTVNLVFYAAWLARYLAQRAPTAGGSRGD
ncbi:MAG: hypothetical protein IT430_18885 [Phycisphaerales bacterium]|nr:hypothetical protein [Phycisphaerales bacterium]